MNQVDKQLMAADYADAESSLNSTFARSVCRLQDKAYEAGLERGFASRRMYYEVLEALQDIVEGCAIKNNEDMPSILQNARKVIAKAEQEDV